MTDDDDDDIVEDDEGEEDEAELLLLQESLAEYIKDPSSAIPWEVAFQRLKERNNA